MRQLMGLLTSQGWGDRPGEMEERVPSPHQVSHHCGKNPGLGVIKLELHSMGKSLYPL